MRLTANYLSSIVRDDSEWSSIFSSSFSIGIITKNSWIAGLNDLVKLYHRGYGTPWTSRCSRVEEQTLHSSHRSRTSSERRWTPKFLIREWLPVTLYSDPRPCELHSQEQEKLLSLNPMIDLPSRQPFILNLSSSILSPSLDESGLRGGSLEDDASGLPCFWVGILGKKDSRGFVVFNILCFGPGLPPRDPPDLPLVPVNFQIYVFLVFFRLEFVPFSPMFFWSGNETPLL
jgi:hypothetical protein